MNSFYVFKKYRVSLFRSLISLVSCFDELEYQLLIFFMNYLNYSFYSINLFRGILGVFL